MSPNIGPCFSQDKRIYSSDLLKNNCIHFNNPFNFSYKLNYYLRECLINTELLEMSDTTRK